MTMFLYMMIRLSPGVRPAENPVRGLKALIKVKEQRVAVVGRV